MGAAIFVVESASLNSLYEKVYTTTKRGPL